ncbi:hypothetical protein [Microbacterium sp. MYb66]|uniref:hypothetical protein n=1 Tax=Microbacterium sp. MYb66 TaxID=1848692 RepID=UPI0011B0BD20|nr:hypothetical protein [Microbacterium sp. MYb66]
MTNQDAGDDFSARMTAFSDRISVRVMCMHAGKGFDGGPVVIVAYLKDGSGIPDYRYWREAISEVGGRVAVVAQARGSKPKEDRPGEPRLRQIMECPCGTGFPFASEDVNSLVRDAAAAGQTILELSAMPTLIGKMHKLRDTP